jgi:chemotaxis protein CheX
MRVEYINPFVEAAYNILSEVLGTEIIRGNLFLKSSSRSVMGVAAIVGLAGEVEGRVLFDMKKDTALKIASVMNMEELTQIDDSGQSHHHRVGQYDHCTGRDKAPRTGFPI